MASRRTYDNLPRKERACIVGVAVRGREQPWQVQDSLEELAALAEASNAEVVARVTQTLQRPSRTYLGSGRLEQVAEETRAGRFDVVLFDDELGPTQQRMLESILEVKVIDRTALILDVFARRARTREGKLQVELAQTEYLLPRLAGQWSHLERLGGSIGTRGPGETQIETDRRLVRNRLSRIKKELERVRAQRARRRRQRARSETHNISLVGYTNAGKSALFNCLTAADVPAADQLFSTLDTTTRRVHLPSGVSAVLSDTVGFVRKLPPVLVEAFQATLEELHQADLLLHVVDISSRQAVDQAEAVDGVLESIGLAGIPRIIVLNKVDLAEAGPDTETPERLASIVARAESCVRTSATGGTGIEALRQAIVEGLGVTAGAGV